MNTETGEICRVPPGTKLMHPWVEITEDQAQLAEELGAQEVRAPIRRQSNHTPPKTRNKNREKMAKASRKAHR